jgi:hypothetical protein
MANYRRHRAFREVYIAALWSEKQKIYPSIFVDRTELYPIHLSIEADFIPAFLVTDLNFLRL